MMTALLENAGRCGCTAGYCRDIEVLRQKEYPYLKESVYLDHAGTTLYAASLVRSFSDNMMASLYGNPHSMSSSSERSTRVINDARLRALAFFSADPDEYDIVFVANATSAIKLVAESFREFQPSGFHYGYHVDSHTSLVGLRELAEIGHRCLGDGDVDGWISEHCTGPTHPPSLFAFPAQSNLNGRRLPMHWCKKVRATAKQERRNAFSLLDAASFVSTAPLNVNEIAPDFVALSFYKIFGFPDLGALIVRKDAVHALDERKFFGGGTVDMVIASGDKWHATKQTSIHERFEDGTLPFHNIIALGAALTTHERLYGSMANISLHTAWLAQEIYEGLSSLEHFNGARLCHMYRAEYGNPEVQGPIVAFNLQNSRGEWIPKTQVETRAAARDIHLRSGSVCNPGGTASSLGWTHIDLRRHFEAGLRCGDDHDVLEGRPTGILRISLGAMTSPEDVQALLRFIRDTYVERVPKMYRLAAPKSSGSLLNSQLQVAKLTIFPILGCGGFDVPAHERWEIHEAGLAWDQVWCVVHQTTNKILGSQDHPQMQGITASVENGRGVLRLSCRKWTGEDDFNLEIPLPAPRPRHLTMPIPESAKDRQYHLTLQKYNSSPIKAFFSKLLGVPCTLAIISSRDAGQPLYPLPPIQTRRSHRWNVWRQKTSWKCFRSTKNGINRSSLPKDRESADIRSSVRAKPVTSLYEPERMSLLDSLASQENNAIITLESRQTHPANERFPFTQHDWKGIRIGKSQIDLHSVQQLKLDNTESLNVSEISKRVTLVLHRQNAPAIYQAYRLQTTEDEDRRRTIAVGDMILPVV